MLVAKNFRILAKYYPRNVTAVAPRGTALVRNSSQTYGRNVARALLSTLDISKYFDKHIKLKPTPISLRDMLKWQSLQSTSTSKLLAHELLTRLAWRIVDLESLPEPTLKTLYTQRVLSIYRNFFCDLGSMYYCAANGGSGANEKWSEHEFVELLKDFSADDSATVPTLAKGVRAAINEYEKKTDASERDFIPSDANLEKFYQSRLGIRMLIGQRIQPRIKTGIDVVAIAKKSFERAKLLSLERFGISPDIEFLGHTCESDWEISELLGGFCYVRGTFYIFRAIKLSS